MHAIVKRLSVEIRKDIPPIKRRSFFLRLFGGIGGGWMAGNLFSKRVHSTSVALSNEEVHVTIHPLAVPRMKKDVISHGT
jgi:hypothetical protein